ncbi:MAG: lipoyl(octanoyl) transferase LipB [Hyphomicrobiales bacterium]|uniref:lipoyl(octanoyl) transferase LipB n=1 Tax=Nisaea sp. TaxID=2024842 RepID=UPI003273B432
MKQKASLPQSRAFKPVDWLSDDQPVPYETALSSMEERVTDIAAGTLPELVWLLEHEPLYTAGTSAQDGDLLTPDRFPVYKTGRGGQYTYHGPGQRIAYVMLDLSHRTQDVRQFVAVLEQWVINTLASFGVTGERREDRVGVWVTRPEKAPLPDGTIREDKIAAIGIRLRKWVSFHGISINVEPDLSHFDGIVPCGVSGHGVTSLYDLGVTATTDDVDLALKTEFSKLFG